MFGALQGYYSTYADTAQQRADEKKAAEARDEGSTIVSFELAAVDWNNLRRKRAFHQGVPMTLKEEWAAPEVLLDFQKVPDVLPLRPRGSLVDCDYNALLKWDRPYEPEEVKGEDGEIDPETPQGPPMDQHLFQYEKANE